MAGTSGSSADGSPNFIKILDFRGVRASILGVLFWPEVHIMLGGALDRGVVTSSSSIELSSVANIICKRKYLIRLRACKRKVNSHFGCLVLKHLFPCLIGVFNHVVGNGGPDGFPRFLRCVQILRCSHLRRLLQFFLISLESRLRPR